MRTPYLLAASLIAVSVAPSYAQTASDADQTPVVSSEAGLNEIVVTAQRKEENLQRAAVAVDAVGGDDILKAGISQVGRLQELVPALSIEPTSSGNLIFIRGVGNFNLTNNSDPATAFNYDDVYIGRPASSEGMFYDLERIEVLKGPQGTLYGRNATAGAINVIPMRPKIGEFSGYGVVGYGNYNALTLESALNVPLGDDGAIRVSGTSVTHDGYLTDGSSDEDTQAFRFQMLANVTPDLTVRASFDYAQQGGEGQGLNYYGTTSYDPTTDTFRTTPSGVEHGGMFSPEAQQYRTTLFMGLLNRNPEPLPRMRYRNHHNYGAHINIEWSSGIGDFTIIPSWRYSSYHDVINPAFTSYVYADTDQESLEFRYASRRVSIFDITAGAMYYREKIKEVQVYNLQASQGFNNNTYETTSKAAYLRLTANITDSLRLVGGARYTTDKKSVDSTFTGLNAICFVPPTGGGCPDVPFIPWTRYLEEQPIIPAPNGVVPLSPVAILARSDAVQNESKRKNRVTWRSAIEYDVSADSFAFASIETGYRSGGFNSAGIAPFDPEFITAYTIGLKNRLFNNRVRLNFEGFVWKYKDQQLSFVGLAPSGTPANMTRNIGQATMKGIEGDLSVLATPSTLLSSTVQFLDAKYDDFVYQSPLQGGRPYTACPITTTTVYTIDCTGFTAYNSPKWTINLSAQQTINLGDFEIVVDLDTQYRSGRYVFFQYVPEQYTGDTWQSNAQVKFGPVSDKWSISAYVRNIEDAQYQVFTPSPPFLSTLNVQWNAPRTYGVRLAVNF
ncbi:MAG: TonB-dependent receptor [Sphingomonadaceae bacterium]